VRKGVKKRLRRHMQALDCPSVAPYLDLLDHRPEVKAACERHLIVTISRFFRDRRLWAALRDRILPERAALLDGPMRAWSAGCANGEEPHSLAIVWEEQATDHKLIVAATDISRRCLERAKAAVYSRSSLKQVPDAMRHTYFDASPAGRTYRLNPLSKSVIRW
jgi:chemotaxis protein methyltransferase CheR